MPMELAFTSFRSISVRLRACAENISIKLEAVQVMLVKYVDEKEYVGEEFSECW